MSERPAPVSPGQGEIFILGINADGREFRPSDWAERLCGAVASYCQDQNMPMRGPIGYSPHVQPALLGGVRSVVMNGALLETAPLAYHFVLGFARDNGLQVLDGCLLPAAPAATS